MLLHIYRVLIFSSCLILASCGGGNSDVINPDPEEEVTTPEEVTPPEEENPDPEEEVTPPEEEVTPPEEENPDPEEEVTPPEEESPDPETVLTSAERGKALYESIEFQCSSCHGNDGLSSQFKLIDLSAEEYTSTSDGIEYPAVEYIEKFMPPAPNTNSCAGECAEDVVAYMRTLAVEAPVEVVPEVPDGTNLALNKEATQSSTTGTASADLAVDGNTDGAYNDGNGSVSLTNGEQQPWWQVDLGSSQNISQINIYNRTDGCCKGRLSDFYVFVSDTEFGSDTLQDIVNKEGVTRYSFGSASDSNLTNIEAGVTGRYVRVQLTVNDNSRLNLAEVEVLSGIGAVTEVPSTEQNTLSPLSRLSNDEFVRSIRTILNLADDSPNIEAAIPLMAAESINAGLTNDSYAQSFSTGIINGYLTVAEAAADDLIGDVNTLDGLEEIIQCDILQEASGRENYSHINCIRDYFRSLVVKLYGTAYNNDAESFDDLLTEVEDYITDAELSSESFEASQFRIRVVFSYMFLLPEFLVFAEQESENIGTLSSIEIAKRLSFFLTGNLPDDELNAAALDGSLTDASVRLEHTNRLLEDSAINNQFAEFFIGWLGISEKDDLADEKDVDALKAWLSDWFGDSRPFGDLYSSNSTVINSDESENTMAVGVLGSRAFVASMTNNPVPSFINRGDFVVTQLLCNNLPDDIPEAAFEESSTVSETPEDLFHELKTQACATCHHVADNYGALFQQFTSETSLFDADLKPYGESFNLTAIGDIEGEFADLVSFGQALGSSQTAAQCASELLYRHSVRRSIFESDVDDEAINVMFSDWIDSGDTSIKSLLRIIVESDHFITRFN